MLPLQRSDRWHSLSVLVVGLGLWLVVVSSLVSLYDLVFRQVLGTSLAERLAQPQPLAAQAEVLALSGLLVLQQCLGFGLVAFLMGLYSRQPRQLLLLARPRLHWLGLAAACLLAMLPLVGSVTILPDEFQLPEAYAELEAQLRQTEAQIERSYAPLLGQWPLLALLVLAVVPSIMEELFFRGFVQQSLLRLGHPVVAVVLTALLFTLVHGQVYGLFARLLLGLLLGVLALWSRSIWVPVTAHFLNNALNVLAGWLVYTGRLSADAVEGRPPLVLVAVASAAATALLWWAWRCREKPKRPDIRPLDA